MKNRRCKRERRFRGGWWRDSRGKPVPSTPVHVQVWLRTQNCVRVRRSNVVEGLLHQKNILLIPGSFEDCVNIPPRDRLEYLCAPKGMTKKEKQRRY